MLRDWAGWVSVHADVHWGWEKNGGGLGEFGFISRNGLIPVRSACPCHVEVDCGHPGTPPYAVMSGEKFTFGSTVRYSCSGDRQLMGESLLSCQLNGHWSGPLPHCSGRGTPMRACYMTHLYETCAYFTLQHVLSLKQAFLSHLVYILSMNM